MGIQGREELTAADRRTLRRLKRDPRIKEVWFEAANGWFAGLVPGFNMEGQISFRGDTVEELGSLLAIVTKGDGY